MKDLKFVSEHLDWEHIKRKADRVLVKAELEARWSTTPLARLSAALEDPTVYDQLVAEHGFNPLEKS